MKWGLRVLTVLASLFIITGTAVAGAIVLSSSAPGVYPRTELDDNYVLKLEAGEEVNLLLKSDGKSTRTKRVTGPFEGKIESLYKNPGVVDVIYQTVRDMWSTGGRRKDGGIGTRGGIRVGGKDWRAILVVGQTGGPVRYCFEKGSAPVLTRNTKMDSRALRITDSELQSRNVELDWAPGVDELAWPSAMPAADGGAYSITNSGAVAEVVLQEVAPGSLEDERALETLAKHKCTVQLDAWLGENG